MYMKTRDSASPGSAVKLRGIVSYLILPYCQIAIFWGRHDQEWSGRLKVSQNNNTATSWLSCCFDFCIYLLSVELSLYTILGGYGGACSILPSCVETNYHCLYTCLSYCVNLLHVINYLIFDKHGQEFKISNGNKKTTQIKVSIFFHLRQSKGCFVSQCVESVSQSTSLSLNQLP